MVVGFGLTFESNILAGISQVFRGVFSYRNEQFCDKKGKLPFSKSMRAVNKQGYYLRTKF